MSEEDEGRVEAAGQLRAQLLERGYTDRMVAVFGLALATQGFAAELDRSLKLEGRGEIARTARLLDLREEGRHELTLLPIIGTELPDVEKAVCLLGAVSAVLQDRRMVPYEEEAPELEEAQLLR